MWNFDDLDTLECAPLAKARMFTTPAVAGPALVFVHGGFHGAWCWTLFMAFFAAHKVRCAAVDLRGHGGQTQSSDFPHQTVDDMADDIIDAARALDDDVIIVAHSAGALAALRAAAHIKPRGLVLVAPGAPAGIVEKAALPAFATDRPIAVPNTERVRKWFLQGSENTDVDAVISRLCPESPAFMNDCFTHGVVIDPRSITCPKLCISGARDHSPLHPRGQDQAVAKFLNAEIEVIADAGHSLMIEPLWRASAIAILGWLRRTGIAAV